LSDLDAAQRAAFVNHRNYSGNTSLHWAALNTHLECVKALVESGADVTVKNDAGHDAVFLLSGLLGLPLPKKSTTMRSRRRRSR
jgi:FOG: Ankyrin repeat